MSAGPYHTQIRKHARTLRSAASAQPLPLQVNKTHTTIRHSGVGNGGGVGGSGGGGGGAGLLSNSSLSSCITTTTTITTAGSDSAMTTMIVPPLEPNSGGQVEIQQLQKSPDGEVLTKKVRNLYLLWVGVAFACYFNLNRRGR